MNIFFILCSFCLDAEPFDCAQDKPSQKFKTWIFSGQFNFQIIDIRLQILCRVKILTLRFISFFMMRLPRRKLLAMTFRAVHCSFCFYWSLGCLDFGTVGSCLLSHLYCSRYDQTELTFLALLAPNFLLKISSCIFW